MTERIAIIDLGSNSARLIVMHIYANNAYNLVYHQKETVRLGEGMGASRTLRPEAMRRAVEGLRLRPSKVLVDGNRLPRLAMRAEAVVGGDARVAAISAASILAKVTRDRWCVEVDAQWPQYGFAAHKGYGTAAHLAALQAHGPCALHRRSFAPVAAALAQARVP